MRTRIRHTDTDTANRIAACSDSKRIRTQNARSIHRSDVDTWGISSSVAWQSFEVVPNVIGPTSTTCERVVHQPAVVHHYVFCVFPSIIYNKFSLPALRHNYSLPPSSHKHISIRPNVKEYTHTIGTFSNMTTRCRRSISLAPDSNVWHRWQHCCLM